MRAKKILKILSLSFAPVAVGGLTLYIADPTKSIPKLSLLDSESFLYLQKLTSPESESEMKLKQVYIVFRHGARTFGTDINSYTDIPNIKKVYWDKEEYLKTLPFADYDLNLVALDGSDPAVSLTENGYKRKGPLNGGAYPGQLTTVGQQDAYELGEWIGKTYIQQHQLLSPTFNQDEVFIRSSNTSRTVMSAKCVLAGLYGKENITEIPKVTTRCISTEYLSPILGICKYRAEWKNFLMSDLAGNFTHHKSTAKELRELLNMTDEDKPLNFVTLYDFLHCRKAHGLHVPEFLLEREDEIKKYASQLQGRVIRSDNEVEGLRRSIGQLVDEICKLTEERDPRKMFLYSAHDSTLIALLMVLGCWDDHWPEFSASLCFELYENEPKEKYLRVLYEGEPLLLDSNDPTNEYLALNKFLKKMRNYRTTDRALECGHKDDDM